MDSWAMPLILIFQISQGSFYATVWDTDSILKSITNKSICVCVCEKGKAELQRSENQNFPINQGLMQEIRPVTTNV